jgi:hypothetical protein
MAANRAASADPVDSLQRRGAAQITIREVDRRLMNLFESLLNHS